MVSHKIIDAKKMNVLPKKTVPKKEEVKEEVKEESKHEDDPQNEEGEGIKQPAKIRWQEKRAQKKADKGENTAEKPEKYKKADKGTLKVKPMKKNQFVFK